MNDPSTMSFALFVVVWISMRIFYFPLGIIWPAMKYTIEYCAIPYEVKTEPHYSLFISLLLVLYCIHLLWTFMILQILYKVLVMRRDPDDIRE